MFDEFFSLLKTSFIVGVIITLVVVVIAVAVKYNEHSKDKERQEKETEEIYKSIRKIKQESQKWSVEEKRGFLERLSQEYQDLQNTKNKVGFSTQKVIMVVINNEIEYCTIDANAVSELYYYIKDQLDEQPNNSNNQRRS